MGAQTVNLRGEGGIVWTFDLPLSETFADQVANGRLRPDDDDSAAALAEYAASAPPEADEATDDSGSEPPEPPAEKPLASMKLDELLAKAEEAGVDADTLEGFRKPGTAKKAVIAAIEAVEAAKSTGGA